MRILGIETSCDETAASVVSSDRKILSNCIRTQVAEHRPYGGVVPEIAARAHLGQLDRLVRQAMEDARVGWNDLSGIAATCGPGLIGGLLVGMMTAKAVAAARGLPFIGVNHLEAHALTARLTDDLAFPYLLLLVSGGHTQILLVEGVGVYRRLGGTLDDAAGEAFDKVAKLLGLGFPGGPALSREAATGRADRFAFPTPLAGRPGCDFSFSGLKTAARQLIESLQPLTERDRADVCASFEAAMARIIAQRAGRAMAAIARDRQPVTGFVVAGGVAANHRIRTALQDECARAGLVLVAPPPALCTDNAAMVAWAGVERLRLGLCDELDLPARPRWPLAS